MKKYKVTLTTSNDTLVLFEYSTHKSKLETKYSSLYRFSYPKTTVKVELDVMDVNNQLNLAI